MMAFRRVAAGWALILGVDTQFYARSMNFRTAKQSIKIEVLECVKSRLHDMPSLAAASIEGNMEALVLIPRKWVGREPLFELHSGLSHLFPHRRGMTCRPRVNSPRQQISRRETHHRRGVIM